VQKELPIGIQDFSEIIAGNYVYVDKTEHYHRLIARGKYYFLSRPRRFGKSLLISTLREIFSGNRELFQDLWIYDKIDWEPRPVILLDFSEIVSRETPLGESLNAEMDRIAILNGLQPIQGNYDQKFRSLIRQLGAVQKVAILVDEYDKPIINFIEDLEKAQENREIMKNLYAVVKGNDQYIAFFMITGVSKFSQVSIFSDLNNLYDITVDQEFATMLGYTEQELRSCFSEHLSALQAASRSTYPDLFATIKEWYNGYSWDGQHFVYNPFSILNLLRKQRFQDFWFATGTPTFLMKLIKKGHYSIFDFENREVSLRAFNTFDIPNIEVNSLLFQTGYLTIKKIDELQQTVTLDFPNKEVAHAFSFHLLSEFAEKRQERTDGLLLRMNGFLQKGNVDGFMESIRALFADIAYPMQPASSSSIENYEKYYHTMFYLALKLLGYDVQAEVLTNTGRIDAVIITAAYIYIVEFKLGDAASAMAQIMEKQYHMKYLATGKKIILLGIGFDTESRNVGGFLVEEAS
jgi:Predicted AAA-ATPase/PD-(D/E)XK nuclease superfamily